MSVSDENMLFWREVEEEDKLINHFGEKMLVYVLDEPRMNKMSRGLCIDCLAYLTQMHLVILWFEQETQSKRH